MCDSRLDKSTSELPLPVDTYCKNMKDADAELKGSKELQIFECAVSNFPDYYTSHHIRDLVEEVNPVHITEPYKTLLNINYCIISLKNKEDVDFIIGKLDGFAIAKERLMVVRCNELL